MRHTTENPMPFRARTAFLLITALLGLTSIACKITGGGNGPDATATYGAEQFNAQLTAIKAGPTETYGAEQFNIQQTAVANPNK